MVLGNAHHRAWDDVFVHIDIRQYCVCKENPATFVNTDAYGQLFFENNPRSADAWEDYLRVKRSV